MPANYDLVAGYYDRLARLVFGDAIFKAQLFLLRSIHAEARVLVVGGGTGWVLEELCRLHPYGLNITYVESSAEMMAKSKVRDTGENQLTFIHAPLQLAALEGAFDVVLTPFLFDNFTDESLKPIFAKMDRHLRDGGLWLFADFQHQKDKYSSKVLLKIMYLFFGIFCRIEASRLPDSAALFRLFHYRELGQESFYGGFIRAVVYQKQPHKGWP